MTCPYRAVPGKGIWSRLEAVGMNTDFHAGLFTAVMMEGTKFAVGPTIVARRHVLVALGGIERVKDYLSSEDFMLGRIAAELGFGVRLSPYVVEHRIGSEGMLQELFAPAALGEDDAPLAALGLCRAVLHAPVAGRILLLPGLPWLLAPARGHGVASHRGGVDRLRTHSNASAFPGCCCPCRICSGLASGSRAFLEIRSTGADSATF